MAKRLLVSLDEERYEDLRRLAFERSVSMAELVRTAMEEALEDDLDAIRIKRGLEEHASDPSGTMTIQEYMESRKIAVPRRTTEDRATKSRRAARKVS